MEPLTKKDIELVARLSGYEYKGNTLLSAASSDEKYKLNTVKGKLKAIARYYANKYNSVYGPFLDAGNSGNDIAIGGTRLGGIWSGLWKGEKNKQYAAQISFVINPKDLSLEIGFYFGRAQSHTVKGEDKRLKVEKLVRLGLSLSDALLENLDFSNKFADLILLGFNPIIDGNRVLPSEWPLLIRDNAKNSQIVISVKPDEFFGTIENTTIDLYVSRLIFLMSAIKWDEQLLDPVIILPDSPVQLAKKAQRLAEIGLKGELYIMEEERIRLTFLGIKDIRYPRHVALESTIYGFDILSLNENGDEIQIEVKTTTRMKEDPYSKMFFISTNEIETYRKNNKNYLVYRVYDIETSPSFEVLDLSNLKMEPNQFKCMY